jgi:hypothetical protein
MSKLSEAGIKKMLFSDSAIFNKVQEVFYFLAKEVLLPVPSMEMSKYQHYRATRIFK